VALWCLSRAGSGKVCSFVVEGVDRWFGFLSNGSVFCVYGVRLLACDCEGGFLILSGSFSAAISARRTPHCKYVCEYASKYLHMCHIMDWMIGWDGFRARLNEAWGIADNHMQKT